MLSGHISDPHLNIPPSVCRFPSFPLFFYKKLINSGSEKMYYAKQYAEAVQKNMARYKHAHKILYANKVWTVCGNSSYSMCITPVKNFQIPLGITELVSVGTIAKPYAHQLSFKIVMEWGDEMIISYYDGNRWEFPNQCAGLKSICGSYFM
jgi:hypothetical protein